LFLFLGLVNARRNLSRSALAVAGSAVAAMIMTSILGLSSGYPPAASLTARTFMGADIVVYATRHLVRPADLRLGPGGATAEETAWQMMSLSPDLVCDLCSLHPELYTSGFLCPDGVDVRPIDVAWLRETLEDNPRVDYVNPAFFLPVRVTYEVLDEQGRVETVQLTRMVLRSRDFAGQAERGGWPFERLDATGTPGRGGEHDRVALLDSQLERLGYDPPSPGTRVLIHVPAVTVEPGGRWRYDFTAETAFEFAISGSYQAQTNWIGWFDEQGTLNTEELYWVTPQVQIPAGTFEDLFAAVSGGAAPRHALQVGLGIAPFSEVEEIAVELGQALPDFTVVSVPRQMDMAHSRGLPEAASRRVPLDALGSPTGEQIGLPVNLGNAFIVLSCMIGALLLASNMLFLVAQRRREIGVLKALGARGADIGAMILSEGLTLSVLGSTAGFALIRLFATWTLVSNRIPMGQIAAATVRHFGLVVGAAALAAVLFGLIPAWQMARLTSMEVLRNE